MRKGVEQGEPAGQRPGGEAARCGGVIETVLQQRSPRLDARLCFPGLELRLCECEEDALAVDKCCWQPVWRICPGAEQFLSLLDLRRRLRDNSLEAHHCSRLAETIQEDKLL